MVPLDVWKLYLNLHTTQYVTAVKYITQNWVNDLMWTANYFTHKNNSVQVNQLKYYDDSQ